MIPGTSPRSTLPPPPPPPPGSGVRWGLGDVALGVPFVLGWAMVFAVVAVVVFGTGTEGEQAVVAISALGQFGATLAWPWVVTRWKGRRSLKVDFGLEGRPIDAALGVGFMVGLLIAGGLVAALVAGALGIDVDEASNTGVIEDAERTAWVGLIAVVVTFLGPVAEEVFFRGLVLRSLQRRWGDAVAVIGSTLIFTLPHVVGEGGIEPQLVLWSQIFVWGLCFALMTVHYRRLGPAIATHVLLNGLATAVTLVT